MTLAAAPSGEFGDRHRVQCAPGARVAPQHEKAPRPFARTKRRPSLQALTDRSLQRCMNVHDQVCRGAYVGDDGHGGNLVAAYEGSDNVAVQNRRR